VSSNIIALDIGEKRIGVAIADMQTPFPAPLTTLEATKDLAAHVAQLLKSKKVVAVVIGFPRNQSGEPTEQTARVQHIAKLLRIPKTIPVYWQDESLTSVKAEAELSRRKKLYTKADVDSLAATYILEDFIRTQNQSIKTQSVQSVVKKNSHKKPKKKLGFVVKIIALCILLCGLCTGAVAAWYVRAISPRTADDVHALISVKPGTGSKQVAQLLEKEQIIRSATAFSMYLKINGVNNLQAGEYRLSSKQSVKDIAAIIASGKVTTANVTVLPGMRLDQIFTGLQKNEYTQADLQVALDSVRDHPLLKNVPKNARLEGYLFPDTYQIGPNTTAEELLRLMLDNFQRQLEKDKSILPGLARQGLTFEQAVIMASIVQKEVPDYETQQKVAQVFLKRYRENIPLGADPTFKYVAALTGQPALPSLDSPYNTRKYTGLPPTAISNFNLSALKALASPADTDYLYFVAGDDKVTHFSKTLQEHEALTRQHCTTLCN
jgi:UPF0755 protein